MSETETIQAAADNFPSRFALSAHPGIFRVSLAASYINDSGEVMLYTQREVSGVWLDFAKSTADELRRNVRTIEAR